MQDDIALEILTKPKDLKLNILADKLSEIQDIPAV